MTAISQEIQFRPRKCCREVGLALLTAAENDVYEYAEVEPSSQALSCEIQAHVKSAESMLTLEVATDELVLEEIPCAVSPVACPASNEFADNLTCIIVDTQHDILQNQAARIAVSDRPRLPFCLSCLPYLPRLPWLVQPSAIGARSRRAKKSPVLGELSRRSVCEVDVLTRSPADRVSARLHASGRSPVSIALTEAFPIESYDISTPAGGSALQFDATFGLSPLHDRHGHA